MNKKKITLYGIIVSALCIILAIALPFNYSIYLSQFYTVLSVTLYMLTLNNAIVNLSVYMHQKHPKLLKENAVEYGKNKGLRLVPFKVFKNRKQLKDKNDPYINLYMGIAMRCITLVLFIFPVMILLTLVRFNFAH